MACNAKAHFEVYRDEAVHAPDIAVTFCAINFCSHMRTMMKIDIIRNKVDANPGDWSLFIIILPLFQDLGMLREDISMAVETFFYWWDPCVLRPAHKGVAETAMDLFDPCMDPMAEKDGLPRADGLMRILEEKIGHHRKQNAGQSQPEKTSLSTSPLFLITRSVFPSLQLRILRRFRTPSLYLLSLGTSAPFGISCHFSLFCSLCF